ncbi:hypothetical protein BAG01nite_36390 [Brevibacillus agri]|uniref:Uncharacterized protein n=1 Tax=Brevibacillus agri TaxID=51101 RepID=A0A3M8BDA4_9BACL|nr:hypothetical protein [Brevibacillus agri]ELK40996.1 hypothetical protein D478_16289 [Brevibacillus agri BAB-2500]MBG9566408.1 hypothetical protein [Brevibacillus agri]MBY0054851.1 hypothetical protein [Brevibacillus agri]MCG5253516.1 hypothetical protein [Brevibacillus agri]MDN4095030.1 hypothetical protein [Brevibacillus agri]
MFQELNGQVAQVKAQLRQKLHAEHNVKLLQEQYKEAVQKRELLHKQLQREQRDVDKLTGMSFGAFFYSLIGKKEEKLSKETEELLQAKMKYEEAADTVKELEEELAEVERRLQQMSDLEARLVALLVEKERLIRKQRPELAMQLRVHSEREAELGAHEKELQEAISAGSAAILQLRKAIDKLDSASSWGTWDMFGGGAISTAMKHNRINEARESIHQAQKSLRRFERELQDVQRQSHIRIEIGEMLTFADFFFDNIITDWIVQDRISTSLRQAKEKRSKVESLLNDLQRELKAVEAEIAELRQKSLALIENA